MKYVLCYLMMAFFFCFSLFTSTVCAEELSKPSTDTYIATFGDSGITLLYFEGLVKSVEERKGYKLTVEEKKKMLDDLIAKRLIYEHAISQGYNEKPEVIKAIKDATTDIIYNTFKADYLKKFEVSDSEAETYYKEHPEKFNVPDLYYGHIFLVMKKTKDGQDIGETGIEAARELEKSIMEKNFSFLETEILEPLILKYNHVQFESYPISNYWKGKQLAEPLDKTLLDDFVKLNPGQIAILEKEAYFAVIALQSMNPMKIQDFKFVKNNVIAQLEATKYSKAIEELILKLSKEYNLKINANLLKDITK